MNIEYSAFTHVGLNRKNNEDNYYVNGVIRKNIENTIEAYSGEDKSEYNLFAVCDGMGGEEIGEITSLEAVKALRNKRDLTYEERAKENAQAANEAVCKKKDEYGVLRAGTTLAALNIFKNQAVAYNIGDSRVYLSREGKLIQLSQDHTAAQRLVEMGVIDSNEAKTHPDRNRLTLYVGMPLDDVVLEPTISEVMELKEDDLFLICSDGLTDMVEEEQISFLINENLASTKLVTEKLIKVALENGGRDNVTVVVVRAEGLNEQGDSNNI